MNSRLLLCLSLVCVLAGACFAQGSGDQTKKADEYFAKMHKIELLNQLLPLAMTKEQIRTILPSVERARDAVKKQHKREFDAMEALSPKVAAALDNAMNKGILPPQETLDAVTKFTQNAANQENLVIIENVDNVLDAMNKTLNVGQLKAAANSLTVQLYEPDIKDPDKATDELKRSVFVRWVMLDADTYDLLVQLSK